MRPHPHTVRSGAGGSFAAAAEHPEIDDEHIWLWEAYSLSGGLVTLPDLLGEIGSSSTPQRASTLGACFREDGMVAFAIEEEVWIPRFQLSRDYRVFHHVTQALRALQPMRSGVQCALWFCSSNQWLGHEAPMDLIQLDGDAVVAAARADASSIAEH